MADHKTVVLPDSRRVLRYEGNDLTGVLGWCATHHEPVWASGDSWTCPADEPDHELTDAPWEQWTDG